MRILGIDPGKHGCGWAEFEHSLLIGCGYGLRAVAFRTYDLVLLERPNVHDTRGTDKQDLIDVALSGGKFLGSVMPGYRYKEMYPVQWKGTVPKSVMLDRIKDALELKELQLIEGYQCRAGLRHNIFDAAGIVLKEIGRL